MDLATSALATARRSTRRGGTRLLIVLLGSDRPCTCVRAKLSAKSQTVIPEPVRERLGVGPGDVVEFELAEDVIAIRRAPDHDRVDPFAVFHEWASAADEDAFADL